MLRISRTSAYALANRWLDTDGAEGLPALRLGRSIRIPAAAIERLAGPDAALAPQHLRLVDAGLAVRARPARAGHGASPRRYGRSGSLIPYAGSVVKRSVSDGGRGG